MELLVVISIIALLMSIMMPALNKVKISAKRVVCATRMRQIHIGAANVAVENKDNLPKGGSHFNEPALGLGKQNRDDALHMAFWEYYNLAAGAGLEISGGFGPALVNSIDAALEVERKLYNSQFRLMWRCATLDGQEWSTNNSGRFAEIYPPNKVDLPFIHTFGNWYAARLGRAYLAGFSTDKWPTPRSDAEKWKSPNKMSDRGDLPLVIDRNFWNDEEDTYAVCHTGKSGKAVSGSTSENPFKNFSGGGTNITYLDGSTEYKKFSECELRHLQAYEAGNGNWYYTRNVFGYW